MTSLNVACKVIYICGGTCVTTFTSTGILYVKEEELGHNHVFRLIHMKCGQS